MRILVTGLNKGFTILEILIVLAIISISGTSFYLILNQPKYFDSYEQILKPTYLKTSLQEVRIRVQSCSLNFMKDFKTYMKN